MIKGISLFVNKNSISTNKTKIQHIKSVFGSYNAEPNRVLSTLKSSKINFYESLVNFYNRRNFFLTKEKREDICLINNIYENIKKPTSKDVKMVEILNISMENLALTFEKTKENSKTYHLMKNFQEDVLEDFSNTKDEIVKDLLMSKNFNHYADNYNLYKPYFQLNKHDKNVVKDLDKMVENKTYDFQKFEKLLSIKDIQFLKNIKENSLFNKDNLLNNYNKNGIELLKKIDLFELFDFNTLNPEMEKNIFDIYKSTNSKNIDLKTFLFKQVYNTKFSNNTNGVNQSELAQNVLNICKAMDNDKYILGFIRKMIKSENFVDISTTNKIINEIPAFKLFVFNNNVFNILQQVRSNSVIEVLDRNITDVNFETKWSKLLRKDREKYKFKSNESLTAKVAKNIKNTFKVVYYNVATTINPNLNKSLKKQPQPQIINKFELAGTSDDILTNHNIFVKNPSNSENNFVKQPQPKTFDVFNFIENNPITIRNKSTASEIRKKRKEEISQNVLNIIKSKLGPKTYAQHQKDFSLYATNIRLSLLSEIFTSIAETRRVDKKIGKLKSNSSNKDVIELYQLINGNNKKLVNYLLKKRNIDNSRMFEVKDIINILKKAEVRILQNKQSNPNYKASSVRAYYNHLYDLKVQEYGKLSKPKK